ncbi:50S ribosomal protein L30 [archaeon]|nr:50S ribosomal protein L30 [archaeon]
MASKTESVKQISEIKELVNSGKAIIGNNKVISAIKNGLVQRVLLAKNAPEELKNDAKYYANLANIEFVELEQDNEELGVICKKNFFIAIIGVSA